MSQPATTSVTAQLTTDQINVHEVVRNVAYTGPHEIKIEKEAEHRWSFQISCVPQRALPRGEFRITGISIFSKHEKQPADRVPVGPGSFFSGFCVYPGDYGSSQSLQLTFDTRLWPAKPKTYYYTIDALWDEAPPTQSSSWDPTMHIEAGGPLPGLWTRFLHWLRRLFGG